MEIKRTYLFELITQIYHSTDLSILSVSYTVDGIEAIMEDSHDKQRYYFKITPTDKEKI